MAKAPDRNREFKYYRLTPAGRRQFAREQSKWAQLISATQKERSPISRVCRRSSAWKRLYLRPEALLNFGCFLHERLAGLR